MLLNNMTGINGVTHHQIGLRLGPLYDLGTIKKSNPLWTLQTLKAQIRFKIRVYKLFITIDLKLILLVD
jgi:hypothetical protein